MISESGRVAATSRGLEFGHFSDVSRARVQRLVSTVGAVYDRAYFVDFKRTARS